VSRPLRSIALLLVLVTVPAPAGADVLLPAGFTVQVYVTGDGFDTSRNAPGMPSTATLAVDGTGLLYLARTGRRYTGGEVEDVFPIYRIPVGGARLRPDVESRFFFGPPLPNPQIAGVRGGRDLFVSTFDRDRKIGVVYRMVDGRAELFAGGTPPPGVPPLLRQPEGAVADAAGNLYVADRDRGVIVRLDPSGRVLDPQYVKVSRPRVLAIDPRGQLWIGADGAAEAPWQRAPGEIWKVSPEGAPSLVLRGPAPAAIGLGPGGHLFVADRHAAEIFVVDAAGKRVDFARFTDGDTPRTLGFAPVTPETRRAGVAGDLFVARIGRGAWPVNEIVRISGPFEQLLRERDAAGR
jgi:hypothetical protein